MGYINWCGHGNGIMYPSFQINNFSDSYFRFFDFINNAEGHYFTVKAGKHLYLPLSCSWMTFKNTKSLHCPI